MLYDVTGEMTLKNVYLCCLLCCSLMFEQRGCLEIVLAGRQRGGLWFILRWTLIYFAGLIFFSFLTFERQVFEVD